jgi:phosphinothricin acetyltransferase
MDSVIRLAAKEDCDAMLGIYSYYVRETVVSLEYEPPTPDEFQRRFDAFTIQFPWLVFEQGGEVLGYAYAHRFHERAAYSWSAECTVYIKNGQHRKGIGRSLYTCLLDILRLQGYKTAVGLICVPNENSEALHKSFGFQKQGVVENAGYKSGLWRSVAWYALSLSDYPDNPSPPVPIGDVTCAKEFSSILSGSVKLAKTM